MRLLDRVRLRLRSLLARQRVESELRAELDFHVEQQTAELIARGLEPRAARQAALRALGDLSRYEEECRDMRRTRGIETFLQDLRYGLRALRASPVFTAMAVLSLGLGIGANTGIFTLTDALLLRDLPVRSPQQLMVIGNPARTNSLSTGGVRGDLLSVPMYRALRDGSRAFSGLLASGRTGRILVGDERAEQPRYVLGRLVSGNYFDVLGVAARIGRTFTASDDRTGGAPVVVISYDYWARRYGRDPKAVGSQLRLNSSPFTVVGVTRPGFFGDVVGVATDVWVPLALQPQLNPGRDFLERWDASWLVLIGRRAPGVTYTQAAREVRARFARLLASRADGAIDADLVDDVHPTTLELGPGAGGLSALRDRFAQPLRALTAIVALVLLIACVNIASLLLERATGRQKEISVRLALGAGRGRLVRQLLTESLLLAAAGGALGLLLAFWADRGLLQLVGLRPSAGLDVHPNLHVLAFTALAVLLTGVLFGLFPALRATRVELAPALRERSRSLAGSGGGSKRWSPGKLLVVSQFAVSLLLLTGAGLFVRTLVNLQHVDLGYRQAAMLMLEVDPVAAGYDGDAIAPFIERLLARLREVPGVERVAISENGLFSGTESHTDITIGRRPSAGREGEPVDYDRVGPGYFAVVGIPMLRGRGIEAGDTVGAARVAVINEAMARRDFASVDPVGQRFAEVNDPQTVYEVVGVAGDAHDHDLRRPVEPRYYSALLQSAQTLTAFNLEIRTARPRTLVAPVRAAVKALDPRVTIIDLQPLSESVGDVVRYDGLVAKLSSVFGLLALLLAAIGLYGVISHAISRRTNEIGIRMVLGASHRGVLRMVVGETLTLALAGAACGVPVALVAARGIAGRLFGVSAHDLPTLVASTTILIAIALLAGAVPGSRAARVDPTEALRQE